MGAGVGDGGIFVAVGHLVNVGLGVAVLVGKAVLVAAEVWVGWGVAVAINDPPTQPETDRAITKTNMICTSVRFCFMRLPSPSYLILKFTRRVMTLID
jgi:hypothetical protein